MVRTRSSQDAPARGDAAAADDEAFGGERPRATKRQRCIIHVDVDAFFVQCEQNKDNTLRDVPVAIRQHGDVICVCHRARALGAKKFGDVRETRALVEKHGGRMVHVPTTDDQRVSYATYTSASYALHAKMASLCQGVLRATGKTLATYEAASIDEAYVQLEHKAEIATRGREFAENLKRAVFDELGFVVSVGVATNKRMAKIASKMAKPDGVVVLSDDADVERALRATPCKSLPHCSSKIVQQKFAAHGLLTAWDVRRFNSKRLEAMIGFSPKLALDVSRAAHGVCDESIVHKVNGKKSISVQMTLTSTPRMMAPHIPRDTVSATGGKPGWFMPLASGETERVERTTRGLSNELFDKLRVHESYEHKWPSTLKVELKFQGTSVSSTRPAAFPIKFEDVDTGDRSALERGSAELAKTIIGRRTTDIIERVSITATNLKSTRDTGPTVEELRAREENPIARALEQSEMKRLRDAASAAERDRETIALRRVDLKRQRNEKWMAGLEPLQPVDMLVALQGGWDGDDECPLAPAECRAALQMREQLVFPNAYDADGFE